MHVEDTPSIAGIESRGRCEFSHLQGQEEEDVDEDVELSIDLFLVPVGPELADRTEREEGCTKP